MLAVNCDLSKKKKYIIPDKFWYAESRALFLTPDVNRNQEELEAQIVFGKPVDPDLTEWLVKDKGFAEVKVKNGIEKLQKS